MFCRAPRACVCQWSVWEYKRNKSRCKNKVGGRQLEWSQMQQPPVTRDHRVSSIPWFSLPNPRVIIETSCLVLRSRSVPTCLTHSFIVPPPTVKVDWAISSMLQHRPAATCSLHITEYLSMGERSLSPFGFVCFNQNFFHPCWFLKTTWFWLLSLKVITEKTALLLHVSHRGESFWLALSVFVAVFGSHCAESGVLPFENCSGLASPLAHPTMLWPQGVIETTETLKRTPQFASFAEWSCCSTSAQIVSASLNSSSSL